MRSNYKNIIGSLAAVYFFVSAIVLIKSSATIMGEALAERIVLLIRDTTSAVFAGWIATALLHSSGAFDSIVVAFTSSGVMPLSLSVATIIGAEIGTTVTPFLISVLERLKGQGESEASFNVTMSHVLYNLFTLALFYPLELFFGVFTSIAWRGSFIFVRASWLKAVPDLLDVVTPWVDPLLEVIPPWAGIVVGGLTLILALGAVEKYMTAIFSMPRSWNLIRSTFTHPMRAFIAGFLFTVLVPSTTVMVSLLVPLAASGVIKADYYILPYILGANIGTVFDVMIAALATGDPIGLGVWLVHLTINVAGAIIFMPLLNPFSRLVRRVSAYVSSSPKTTLVIAALFHIIPTLVILYYYLT
ncbi:Na/Pi cotransporter family protein [Candidatus Bathyarchaeota archaeon]|nr:Na/Pi cotransporter family protein [Candidatus Bathyarchaeota archaeon]